MSTPANQQTVNLDIQGAGIFGIKISKAQTITFSAIDSNNVSGWIGDVQVLANVTYYVKLLNGSLTVINNTSKSYVPIYNQYTKESSTTATDNFFNSTIKFYVYCSSNEYTLVCNGNCPDPGAVTSSGTSRL
jgi:hypothetical protein